MQPSSRYLVPDLSPRDRLSLKSVHPHLIFVAESPHVSEVEPEELAQRRPLCGAAGRQWWSLLTEILEGHPNSDVTLNRLVDFCGRHQIAVMNAVQYPLDPKITRVFPEADPVKNLGFSKVSGAYSFKRLKNTEPVKTAILRLAERLNDPSVKGIPIYSLGNDADWFVSQALSLAHAEESVQGQLLKDRLAKDRLAKDRSSQDRLKGKIPHPSAWWRQGGWFGQVAREKLNEIFAQNHLTLAKGSPANLLHQSKENRNPKQIHKKT
jgi:hypothetical protein